MDFIRMFSEKLLTDFVEKHKISLISQDIIKAFLLEFLIQNKPSDMKNKIKKTSIKFAQGIEDYKEWKKDNTKMPTYCMWYFKSENVLCSEKKSILIDNIPLCKECSQKKSKNKFLNEIEKISFETCDEKKNRLFFET